MNDPKEIILKVLEIIGYSNDKEKFTAGFLQSIDAQSLLNLINSLPSDKQEEARQKLAGVQDPKAAGELLKPYFSKEQIISSLQNSAKNMMTEYIKAIENTLSEEQKTNLANYFQELSQPTAPTV